MINNNLEMKSLVEDDTDNDDCSLNKNDNENPHDIPTQDDDEATTSPPALTSTSSCSSDEYNNNTISQADSTTAQTTTHTKPPPSTTHHSSSLTNILSLSPNNHNIGSPITPLHNIPYVHGGYAAAAPLFVTHSKFASVLKRLLPKAYLELRGLLHRNDQSGTAATGSAGGHEAKDLLREYSVNNDLLADSQSCNDSIQHRQQQQQTNNNNNNICITDPVKIMKWAENNPIVSAFGIWNSDNGRRTKRFMQGVVVTKSSSQPPPTTEVGAGEEKNNSRVVKVDSTTKSSTMNNNEGSPLRKRLKERIDRSRYKRDVTPPPPPKSASSTSDNNNNDETISLTTVHDEPTKHDVIDEQHLTSLLQSLSSNYSSSEVSNAADDGSSFDLSFRDRGNSSVVEAVMSNNDITANNSGVNNGGRGTQQRLLRNYQQQQQQQRKKEFTHGAAVTSSSSSHLPPLPPTNTSSYSRQSTPTKNSYSRQHSMTPPPPPGGTTLLKGGGKSGPGGVSSPRRRIPLPSDLPNSTTTTTTVVNATTTFDGEGGGSSSSNSSRRIRSRSISLTNTSYDAYLNEHHHRLQQHSYNNRQRTNSSSSTTFLDTEHHQQPYYYNKPAIEWDIFLDPQLVRLVDAALTVVDDLEGKLHKIRLKRERIRQQRKREREERMMKRKRREEMRRRMRMNGGGFGMIKYDDGDDNDDNSSDDSTAWNDGEDDQDFDLLQAHTAAQVEVDRLVAQLMRRTIIAHGSMSQLVLEGLGWAPEYNFGRVVKCSREGTNLPSPQRRNGGHGHRNYGSGSDKKDYLTASLSFSDTLSWDEEEEQRDFEALLDRRIHSSSVAGTSGGGGGGGAASTGKGGGSSSGTHHSKGMFMEKWLSLFAKSLSLLARSTNPTSSGGDAGGGDSNDDIVKSSSSSLFVPHQKKKKKKDAEAQLVKIKKKKEKRGFACHLSSLFFGSDKSSTADSDDDEEEDVDNDRENDNNDDDDDKSAYLTNNDMFSPATKVPKSGILGGLGCGMSLCLGMDDDEVRFNCGTSTSQTSNSVFPLNPHASHQMARDIQRIHDVLGEPLRLVLDLKSRRVPPRVWSRLIDNLRSRGLLIEGIGSFDMDELRVIGKGCSYPLTPILFFHSVGDLQRACHANEVKKGDTVYFNGGSLMWKRSSIMEAAECGGCCAQVNVDDDSDILPNNGYERTSSTATTGTTSARTLNAKGGYSFQPYAYPRSALSDWERVQCKSTIEDYRRHFDLKIGVYVQGETISYLLIHSSCVEQIQSLIHFVLLHYISCRVFNKPGCFRGIDRVC